MRVVIELAGVVRGKGAVRARAFRPHGSATVRTQVFTDSETVKWETEIRHAGTLAMAGLPPFDLPVSIIVEARFPIPLSLSATRRAAALAGQIRPTVKPDYDNISKSLGDGLNQIVWVDDKQIVDARIRKIYSERPGLTVIVETIDPPEPPQQRGSLL